MIIGGLQKNSFVDYPNGIAIVLFTQGCNMNCTYCHNKQFIGDKYNDSIDIDYVENFLVKRKNIIDAVVISGGEPTLHKDLEDYIIKIKKIGYKIKLDTNGSNPQVIKNLIKKKLVDYIAMDIKAPEDKFREITRSNINIENIYKSIRCIMNSNIDYEFRTTLCHPLNAQDVYSIINMINGCKKYVLQQCRIMEEDSDNNFMKYTGKEYKITGLDNEIINMKTLVDEIVIKGEV